MKYPGPHRSQVGRRFLPVCLSLLDLVHCVNSLFLFVFLLSFSFLKFSLAGAAAASGAAAAGAAFGASSFFGYWRFLGHYAVASSLGFSGGLLRMR